MLYPLSYGRAFDDSPPRAGGRESASLSPRLSCRHSPTRGSDLEGRDGCADAVGVRRAGEAELPSQMRRTQRPKNTAQFVPRA